MGRTVWFCILFFIPDSASLGHIFHVVRRDSAHLCAFFINAEVVIEVQVSDEAFSTALKWPFVSRCRGYVSVCWYPRMAERVSYLRWLLFLLRRLLITLWVYICRGRKLGRVEIQREDKDATRSFWPGLCGPTRIPVWWAVPADPLGFLCRGTPARCWAEAFCVGEPWRPPSLPCLAERGREEAGCAGNAAGGQRAPLPLCRCCSPAAPLPPATAAGLSASCSPPRNTPWSRFRSRQEPVTKDIRKLKSE